MRRWAFVLALIVCSFEFCGGTTATPDAGVDAQACAVGSTRDCTGPAQCSGSQVCNTTGGYGSCECVAIDASVDGGSDAQADASADAGAWTPKMLPGLCVWLDDTVGIVLDTNGQVQTWTDQSGLGNDAITNAQTRPNLVANAINKHSVVQMQNHPLQIDDATCLDFGSSPFAIVMVATGGNSSTLWNSFSSNTGIDWTIGGSGLTGDMLATSHVTSVEDKSFDTTTFHTITLVGPGLQFVVDTVVFDGGVATDDLGSSGQTITMGLGPSIELAELIVVNAVLSPSDQTNLANYFNAKFGL